MIVDSRYIYISNCPKNHCHPWMTPLWIPWRKSYPGPLSMTTICTCPKKRCGN